MRILSSNERESLVLMNCIFRTLLTFSSAGPERPHIYICLFICGVSALGYFAMLSGQGWTAIAGCRQFFYARYFDWAVTNSLIVVNLGLIAGADGASSAATTAAEGASLVSVRSCVIERSSLLANYVERRIRF